ncbi:IS5 family transposase [Brucella intermedia]|uniref:IS5 family transposase n=1 Tax=Brucella intermedia TaxID=94625 RepID=UPI00124CCF84|nr:IS5 family transposase [Brucella intermedia]KAB2732359.1 IS5 family transposase [Brucella intermedia]
MLIAVATLGGADEGRAGSCLSVGQDTCGIDGDTFTFRSERIRIANIDAPEIGHPKCDAERRLGLVARKRLAELLGGGEVEIRRGDPKSGRVRDRYGRSLSIVYVDGRDAGEMLISEELARPWCGKLTAGQAHDGRSAADMFETLGSGQILLADRAYDSDNLRQSLKERGAWDCIRPMPNRVNIPAFSPWLYKQRNAVERFFNKLKHFRAIATRYDKRDDNFLASIQLASIRIWLRSYESVT